MKQEDKDLLLKDLCSRLPYNVKCAEVHPNNKFVNKWDIVKIGKFIEDGIFISNCEETYGYVSQIENIKPYLFPLSSMTEEIMDEIYEVSGVYDIGIDSPVHIEVGTTFEELTKIFHILNKYHIDYMGLIPMGLALDATGKNIY
jgi:hypothetical protein